MESRTLTNLVWFVALILPTQFICLSTKIIYYFKFIFIFSIFLSFLQKINKKNIIFFSVIFVI